MNDIDWLAVNWVVTEGKSLKLTPAEKRAAIRRLDARMANTSSIYEDGIPIWDVARRLQVDKRSVTRLRADLPAAEQDTCPVCRQAMWVCGGVVEPHCDRLYEHCPYSGQRVRCGLAAMRPDLYQWVTA